MTDNERTHAAAMVIMKACNWDKLTGDHYQVRYNDCALKLAKECLDAAFPKKEIAIHKAITPDDPETSG